MVKKLNYDNWISEHKDILKSLGDKQVFMLYTGGKDCSILLDYFLRARKEFNFNFETHAGMFPKHLFIQDEVSKMDQYWRGRGVDIIWHDIAENDDEFEEAREKGINPCSVCHGTKRKYFMNLLRDSVDDWSSLVIIIGYTLWDLVSYSLEYLLGQVYFHDGDSSLLFQGRSIKDRYLQTSQRFYPLIKVEGGISILKPLLKYNDQEILEEIENNKIPLSTYPCKYKDHRPKRILSSGYKQMDLHFDYEKVFSFAKEKLDLFGETTYEKFSKEEYLTNIL